jgi:hypothetical protein
VLLQAVAVGLVGPVVAAVAEAAGALWAFCQVASSTPAGFWKNPPAPPGNPPRPPKLPDGRGRGSPEGRAWPEGRPPYPPGPRDAPVRGAKDGSVMVTPFFFMQSTYAVSA